MDRIRVLYAFTSLAGGALKAIKNLLVHMDKERFDLTVAYFHIKSVRNIPGDYWQELRRHGVRVEILPMGGKFDPRVVGELLSFLRRERFDLVDLPLRIVDGFVALIAKGLGIPVLVSKHGLLKHTTVKSYVRLPRHLWCAMYPIEKLSLLCADMIRTVSHANKDRYVETFHVNPDKIMVIPNGLEPDEESSAGSGLSEYRTAITPSGDTPVVGLVASLHPIKGLPYFIEAAFYAREKEPKAKFPIICNVTPKMQPYRAHLLRLIDRFQLRETVKFVPYRPDAYGILDIVVVPSIVEDCPHVVLEAMKYGKPVIASNAGGIPEIVVDGQTGLLVPVGDPRALADRISFLLENEDQAKRMGMQGRQRLEERFSITDVVAKIEAAYEQLVSRSTKKGSKRLR